MNFLAILVVVVCYLQAAVATPFAPSDPQIEVGQAQIAADSTTFTQVQFDTIFNTVPVVIATPINADVNATTTRVRAVTTTGFELAVVRALSDGLSVAQNITYVAMEIGTGTVGAITLEALRPTVANAVGDDAGTVQGQFDIVSFLTPFPGVPAILTSIQTTNSETQQPPSDQSNPFLNVAINSVTTSQIQVALELGKPTPSEAPTQPEQVGIIAVSVGNEAGVAMRMCNKGTNVATAIHSQIVGGVMARPGVFATLTGFSAVPLVAASQNSRVGPNGGWVRTNTITNTQARVFVDETGPVRIHSSAEQVAVVAFAGAAASNTAPVLSALTSTNPNQGSNATVTFTITDTSRSEMFTINVNWDAFDSTDDAMETIMVSGDASGVTSVTLSRRFTIATVGSNVNSVMVTVTDACGASDTASTTFDVLNVAPSLSLIKIGCETCTSGNSIEGQVTTLNATIVEPGPSDTVSVSVNWGDAVNPVVTQNLMGGQNFVLTNNYADNNAPGSPYRVSVTSMDNNNGQTTQLFVVDVANANPVLTVTNIPMTIAEGVSFRPIVNVVDVPADLPVDIVINWGDGTPNAEFKSTAAVPQHAFADNGNIVVTVTATDKDGGQSQVTSNVVVTNTAPVVNINNINNLGDGRVQLEVSVADAAGDFPVDAVIHWGDGTTQTVVFKTAGTQSITREIKPSPAVTAFNANIMVVVTDKDGATGRDQQQQALTFNNFAPKLTLTAQATALSEDNQFMVVFTLTNTNSRSIDVADVVISLGFDGADIVSANSVDGSVQSTGVDPEATWTVQRLGAGKQAQLILSVLTNGNGATISAVPVENGTKACLSNAATCGNGYKLDDTDNAQLLAFVDWRNQ